MIYRISQIPVLLISLIVGITFLLSTCTDEDDGIVTLDNDDTLTPNVSNSYPADGSTDVPVNSNISVSFSSKIDISTVTTNTADTSCSGTIQLSMTEFADCVQMLDSSADIENKTFVVFPRSNLLGETKYKLKVTTDVTDTAGNALAEVYVYKTGYATVADLSDTKAKPHSSLLMLQIRPFLPM
jgi:Big-like domain-containing protein